jgi:hypothetical protein
MADRPAEFRAPLFQGLVERMAAGGRWVVLDLGSVRPETLALLSEFRCRLEIADLGEHLQALVPDEGEDPARLRERVEELLPPRAPEAPDVVFAWDLLNYLERPALAALSSRLAARAAPGTLVHALIAYRDPMMPAAPAGYCPADGIHLRRLSRDADVRRAPRYTPEDLGRAFAEFSLERAVLLGNGMQEFLLRR